MGRSCKHLDCFGPCKKAEPKKKQGIRRVSKKRAKINRAYFPKSKQFVIDNPECMIKSPVCTGRTQGPHHPEGRLGGNLLRLDKCIPACNPCNVWVEANTNKAKEMGVLRSRLHK